LLAAAFLLLLFSRRPEQLLSPQVWSEDGIHVLGDLLSRGWGSIADPLYDYLLLVPKLVSALSLWISFYHYPLVSTLLSWTVIVAVGVAIARSPTSLRAPAWCALAVFLVPSDPEVFGLPLYTFWWTTLLLLLAALWNDEGRGWGWRLAFIVLGGLSSPVIVLIPPALVARAFVARNSRHEWLAAAVAGLVAGVQVSIAFNYEHGPRVPVQFASVLQHTLPVLVGKFLAGSWGAKLPLLWAGVVLLATAAVLHVRRGQDRQTFWTLAYLLAGTLAMVAARVDPVYLDTRSIGPRYFFLPFVLIGWILVQCVAAEPRSPRGILGGLLLLAATANAVPVWSRSHVDVRWAEHVRSCARFPSYPIPILLDGTWYPPEVSHATRQHVRDLHVTGPVARPARRWKPSDPALPPGRGGHSRREQRARHARVGDDAGRRRATQQHPGLSRDRVLPGIRRRDRRGAGAHDPKRAAAVPLGPGLRPGPHHRGTRARVQLLVASGSRVDLPRIRPQRPAGTVRRAHRGPGA
jgi:hypothetical protein